MNLTSLGIVSSGVATVVMGASARPSLRLGAFGRLYLPTVVIAAASGALAWYGWNALSSPMASIRAGQLAYAGPVVLGFVLVVLALERLWPAEARPVLARGHVLDLGYLVAYAVIVLPLVTVLGAGFVALIDAHASWLTVPRIPGVPGWVFIVVALMAIDATDWLVHLVNHQLNALWRLHAVHHSQEEVSVLTTFRAHPLVHLSFVFAALPGFILAANATTPAILMTTYACLGALPHANLRWSYGPFGRVFSSPAYHRAHHRSSGRLDVNLGVVFSLWDVLSRRAIFPDPSAAVLATGLGGRPIPVEQEGARARFGHVFAVQWLEPFLKPGWRSADRDGYSSDAPPRTSVSV